MIKKRKKKKRRGVEFKTATSPNMKFAGENFIPEMRQGFK